MLRPHDPSRIARTSGARALGCGAWGAVLLATCATAQAQGSAKQYEAQLNAIRQAILEATVDRPTRVLSSAWVDDKGALHESAHFHSEAQVRGVRVLSYLQDGQEPQTRVSAEVLPWGWKTASGAAGPCSPAPKPWRLPLVVQTRTEPGFTGPQAYASQSLLQTVQQVWGQKMLDSQRWRAQWPTPASDNPYLRALTGASETPSGWAAELVLKPHAPAPMQGGVWQQALHNWLPPAPLWRWTLSLRIGERHSPSAPLEPHWQSDQVITIDPATLGQSPGAWSQLLPEQLQAQMQAWVQQLDNRTACEPLQFHVRRQAHAPLQLQAGLDSGLRPGDRVLLMNPSHVPSRLLEPGASQHLALAQVVKVGAYSTELQQLAGPALAPQGHWVALPL